MNIPATAVTAVTKEDRRQSNEKPFAYHISSNLG